MRSLNSNDHNKPKDKPKLLLMGYNGANNTGSEARLLAIIEDIRSVLGQEVDITVPSLNPTNLRRYLKEGPHQRIERVPSIYFFALRRMVKEHDVILLVEGSCYMDTWTSALLWAFLWVSKYAHKYGKPSMAYAVDSGELSQGNQRRVQRIASKTDLIITRTSTTAEHLKKIGVTAPMEVTADTAFTFCMNPKDEDILRKVWTNTKSGVVGLSVLDFHLWPVIVRPWGRKEHCYRWPYYFSRSKARCSASEDLAKGWAAEADRIIEEFDKSIALICMEQLDEPIAREIYDRMRHSDQAKIFSSREHNTSQMTAILRSLDLLVTSRYHAAVLSLAAEIPQIALGHDLRLKRFYQDLGLFNNFFVESDSPNMWVEIKDKVNSLMANPKLQHEKLNQGYKDHLNRANHNRELLKNFIIEHGWG
jgi:polysaccharide pyruvyl transferase WcaK-like protein